MKTKKLDRALALVLILAAALSLAACGKTAEEQTEVAPEYVYESAFSPLDTKATGQMVVMVYAEDGAYATCSEKTGREIPEGADTEGMTEEELSRFDVYTENIYFIDSAGRAEKLPDYKPMEGYENEDGKTDFYSSPYLGAMALDGSGRLLTVETLYTGWYDGPEGKSYADADYYDYMKSNQEVFLRTLDKTGAELGRVQLELGADQYFRFCSATDGDGNLLGSVETQLCAYSPDGRQVYSVDCGGYIQSVVKLADGRIFVSVWGDNGLALLPFDSATQTLGKSLAMPNDAYDPIAGSGDYDLYYTSGLNFFGYDLETQTAEKLFNWINCDVNSDNLSLLRVEADGTVSGYISEYDIVDDSYSNECMTVSKTPYDPQSERATLTLACMSLPDNARSAVIKYNRSSDGARIEIKDYSEFNSSDGSESGAQKLLTEMMAGEVADLIAIDGLPYRRIAAKGLLEDLYPYIDADSELKREDFFQNIFGVLEVEDKLCAICPSFYVAAVMGAESVVGDRTSWTYDEFSEALAQMPEGCEPFESGVSRSDILRTCLVLDMPDYVDWSTGRCSFETEQFTELLEFAAQFPEQHEDDREENTQQRISTGQQMLLATSIYSLDDALYDCSYFGGQKVRYIGFPTYSGSGNVLMLDSGFAMSSECADKEAAWEFLRGFLTEKYQQNNVWSIPTNLRAFEYKLAETMKTNYMLDENGQYELDENGERIKEPRYTMSVDDGPVVNIYAMSQEQADEISSVVKAATKFYDYDESIISIVCEEAEAFFAGQKSAADVAKLIQGKVNIYVNEQS